MQPAIEISDDYISEAEKILLGTNGKFDEERRSFITDFETFDLQAVPGSGKTTALLAKLISLENFLPFENGSGILVLSHTNAAVDEIKNKIGQHCPKLFSYPNFVGTIQSFVDTFLAIPYYKKLYGKKPVRIDDEIYIENHFPDFRLKAFLARRGDGNTLLYNYTLRSNNDLRLGVSNDLFPFGSHTDTFKKIFAIKNSLRDRGFLSFNDAYVLADEYLKCCKKVKDILRLRFPYVFVDEMQDMDEHQYGLLEELFYCPGKVVFQRIGDKNQAIFNEEASLADVWQDRDVKELNGSHRLSPRISQIVQALALRPIKVTGLGKNSDGSAIDIKPKIIIYDDSTIEKVLPKFVAIIKELKTAGLIPPPAQNGYKAVAWTSRKEGELRGDKVKLNHFFEAFSKEQQKPKINYGSLESYLYNFSSERRNFASIRKNLLNAVLRVLRLEEIVNATDSRSFTKRSLLSFLKEKHPAVYSGLKLSLFRMCRLILMNKQSEALIILKAQVGDILSAFGKGIKKSNTFLAGVHTPSTTPTNTGASALYNCYCEDDIKVHVGTVHSVKGQTHTCTLYMETFYQRNIQKKGNYESTRISDQLLGATIPDDAHEFIKQTMKMTYVGFSRPTHLLCFAVHRDRYEQSLKGLDGNIWDVYDDLPTGNFVGHDVNSVPICLSEKAERNT